MISFFSFMIKVMIKRMDPAEDHAPEQDQDQDQDLVSYLSNLKYLHAKRMPHIESHYLYINVILFRVENCPL